VKSDADDKSYAEAGPRALGRMFAEMLSGMIEGGMTREEALEILKEYAASLAATVTTRSPGES
jgi:hypothetical protein